MYERILLRIRQKVLTGRIVERQRERATGKAKYVVSGESEGGEQVEVVGRLSATGKLVIVTVYRA